MSNLIGFYPRLPIVMQNAACSLMGFWIQHDRYGEGFAARLEQAERRATDTEEALEEYRDARVRAMVAHAAATVPYYRDLFRKLGATPGDFRTARDLARLPLLTKSDVQNAPRLFLSESLSGLRLREATTSGTTGSGLRLTTTLDAIQEQWAIWWRYRRWHGIQPGTWCGYFGGRRVVESGQRRPPFWRTNRPGRQILFSAHHVARSNFRYYVEKLRREQPPWLHGYPSILAQLAEYILDKHEHPGYQVQWITTGAENLPEPQKALIQRAFGVRPRQHYGLVEGVANFSECEQGRLHVDEDFSIVEFLPLPDNQGHRVVGTNLINLATPLLRYDTDDLVTLGPGSCGCGRPGRIVERIDGRAEDFLVLPDGRRVGPANHFFKYLDNVRLGQIVYRQRGQVLIRIVRTRQYNEDSERKLRRQIITFFGHNLPVRIEYCEELPRTASGKHRAILIEDPPEPVAASPAGSVRPSTLSLYAKLPPILQTAACSLEGWRIRMGRYGSAFKPILQEYESRSSASREQIFEFRDQRLREFLSGPVAATPYYRELFARLSLDPRELRGQAELASLPVMRKEQVQNRGADFESSTVGRRERVPAHTSGTIGAGLRFSSTVSALREQWAVWWRYRRWHGIGFDTWCGYFGGRSVVPITCHRPPFCRVNYAGRQLMFSAYHLNERNLEEYVRELRRQKPPWLHGYPSLLALVAAWLVDRRTDLGYTVRWVTTGAENLMPQQRRLIERAFGVTPRQHYGMAEAVANFSECERGRMHVDEDFSSVEFLPVEGTDVFRIVGTNFTNPATPLVRYDTQDLVRLSPASCACGRPGRVVEDVDGRQEDYVILSNGARLGRMDHILKDMTNIREAQIVQRNSGQFTYRIVRGDNYTARDEARLLAETRLRVGPLAEVEIAYVDSIPRTATGKLRFVVSTLPDGQLLGVRR